MNLEKPTGDMDAEIRVDPDQIGVEGGMVDFGQRQAVRDNRLPKLFIGVHDDVSGIKQPRFGHARNRAPAPVGGQDGVSERR